MIRIPRPAMALWHYLRSIGKLYGWIRMRVSTMMRKFERSESTINRWLGALRAAGILHSEQHGQNCCVYTILVAQNDRPEPPLSLYEPLEEVSPTEKQNHPDDAASLAETARKSAGFERLSEGDRRYLAELQRAGTPTEAIRAGILVGRARRMVADHNQGRRQPIRSLRYFAALFAEKFEAGYVEHVAGWLQRRSV